MRKLLFALAVFSATISSAQDCTLPFISEYVEGWSNNKAIEIYNPSGYPVDLTPYGLVRFSNGSTDFGSITYLAGITVAAHDVLVVVLDKRDTTKTGIELEAPVWDELWAVADVFINPTYDNGIWVMYFNGNDAVALLTDDGETLIDLFGKIGEGSDFLGWGPYTTDGGDPAYMSQDHTLIRHSDVQHGVSTNPASFDLQAEWDSLPANTFTDLGHHSCLCGDTKVPSGLQSSSVKVFPNPMTENTLSIIAEVGIAEIRVNDLNGRTIQRETKIDLDIEEKIYLKMPSYENLRGFENPAGLS